ncbi:MAG: MgtC/SapB family protein [Deltaproteobacteria bacterium]|nr:MAG: MgtC/SapB family protein [Deltaproteobacteria bacterium]
MDYFDPLGPTFWTTVGTALLCGAIIGVERQLRGKPAGVRTSVLICISTSVFIELGEAASGGSADPTRVLGQLVTGVGFLGAGVILAREGTVTGVTTAAVIWVLAAIGAAIGLGQHLGAIALAVVTVGVLTGVELLESSVRRLARGIYQRD